MGFCSLVLLTNEDTELRKRLRMGDKNLQKLIWGCGWAFQGVV